MKIETKKLNEAEYLDLMNYEESHFADLKSVNIAPAKLSRTISAFANTSGGEIYIGIDESVGEDGKLREWRGFVDVEAANAIF